MTFVDTSWWFSWSAEDDDRHLVAMSLLRLNLGPLVTTNLVVGETWTLLRKRAHHGAAVRYLDAATRLRQRGQLTVHRVSEDEEAAAWAWLRRHDERVYSFVDATSFEVMRSRRIHDALAFDQDFAAAGFIELRP